jgi:hypothetical protein
MAGTAISVHPETLADGAAHLAHLAAPARAADDVGDQRRYRRDHTHAEHELDEEHVGAERAGGQELRAEPAHHHDVGGLDRDLGELAQRQRHGERQGRAGFSPPRRRRLETGMCEGFVHGAATVAANRRTAKRLRFSRHPRESGGPAFCLQSWIPAYAGMTIKRNCCVGPTGPA